MAMKIAIYARVSTSDKEQNVETKLMPLRGVCAAQGWQIVAEYVDHAPANDLAHRVRWRHLLDDAAKKKFSVVLVFKLDRAFRSVKHMHDTLSAWELVRVSFKSLREQFDTFTALGRLLLQVLGSFAEFSSDMLAEHVKKGLKERATQGKRVGGIPFGYYSCWTKEHGEKKLLCDPEHPGGIHLVNDEAEVLKELYYRYAAGDVSCGELASWLNGRGSVPGTPRSCPMNRVCSLKSPDSLPPTEWPIFLRTASTPVMCPTRGNTSRVSTRHWFRRKYSTWPRTPLERTTAGPAR